MIEGTRLIVEEPILEEELIREALPSDTVEGDEGIVEGDEGKLRYLLKVAGVMVVLYLIPFLLARSPFYDRVNPSFYARPLNYPFKTAGQNADVVLFGDSTALLGIDPSRMSSALGVKVLNLSNTQPSLVVNDDMALRYYLSTNHAPRLIIFYFAPWDFDYGHVDFNMRPVYEGEELLMRRGTRQEVLAFARKHPEEAVLFPLRFYATAWELALRRVPHANQDTQLAATRGHVDSADTTVLHAPCRFPQLLIDNVRFSWVHDLGERYKSATTQVLFYAAPMPSCTNAAEIAGRPYNQLPADPPKQAPPEYFVRDIRFIHPRAFAVPLITQNLIDAVGPLLGPEATRPAETAGETLDPSPAGWLP